MSSDEVNEQDWVVPYSETAKRNQDGLTPLQMMVKAYWSLDGEPVFHYWMGEVYRHVGVKEATADFPATGAAFPFQPPLFKMVGCGINRSRFDPELVRKDGSKGPGYANSGGEMLLFLDPVSGKVLNEWENPFIPVNPDGTGGVVKKKVQVMHWCTLGHDSQLLEGVSDLFNYTELSPTHVMYGRPLILKYQSPLVGEKYRRFSPDDTNQSVECGRVIVNRQELVDPTLPAVKDMRFSWTKVGQYVPWMHMGQAPGGLIYLTEGYKVSGGFEALPAWLKTYIRDAYPGFEHAGEHKPAEGQEHEPHTSLELFKRELDAGRYIPTPIP